MAQPRTTRRARALASTPPSRPPRVTIDAVLPEVDGGRFATKRATGDRLRVQAHIVGDGQEAIAAALLHRPLGKTAWARVAMRPLGNDEWEASFVCGEPGRYHYTVEAWLDRFTTWRTDLEKRVAASWDVSSELLEGAELVRSAATRTPRKYGRRIRELAAALADTGTPPARRAEVALDPSVAELMALAPDLEGAARYGRELELVVDRQRARFGAWYEMFPRSYGAEPHRGGTFEDAARRLPAIAAMGFDVLYLPPVHPIGTTARKGKNNALRAKPSDVGSPWAIGSEAGGHTAVHPDLGTLEDFDWFVEQARAQGLEVALDIAFQCSPDHPWVREHPQWFKHRPDGTIKYAENPPKQYEDIYPLNFDCEDWQSLWAALLQVFEFWIAHGVEIFRVDNPHTKPFAFWEWTIGEIKKRHPGAILLAEAFTRPKRMEALAKLGFTQSYTYFTWRNTKQEIVDYFTEITTPPVSDFLRPNLFVNTPDILHEYLQVGGRPAFLVRLVLAAALGPSYGMYSGYELCEARAVPGTEEYLDSEKYQIKHRDWDAPGNIVAAVTRINRLRRELPALQHNEGLWFLPIENSEIVAFMKHAPEGGGHVLVVVNVDVRSVQEGWLGVPLGDLGLAPDEPYIVHDLLRDERYLWRGEWNFVRLDPADPAGPAHVMVFEGPVRREQQIDAFA